MLIPVNTGAWERTSLSDSFDMSYSPVPAIACGAANEPTKERFFVRAKTYGLKLVSAVDAIQVDTPTPIYVQ